MSKRIRIVGASQIYEITRNSEKSRNIAANGHPRLSTLVTIESAYAISY